MNNDFKIIMIDDLETGTQKYYRIGNIKMLNRVNKCTYIFHSDNISRSCIGKTSISYSSEEGKFVSYLRHGELPTINTSKYDYHVKFDH